MARDFEACVADRMEWIEWGLAAGIIALLLAALVSLLGVEAAAILAALMIMPAIAIGTTAAATTVCYLES